MKLSATLQCFVCVACGKKLTAGDFFALRDEGLYCNEHHRACDKLEGGEGPENNNNKLVQNHNRDLSEDGDDKSEEGRSSELDKHCRGLCEN